MATVVSFLVVLRCAGDAFDGLVSLDPERAYESRKPDHRNSWTEFGQLSALAALHTCSGLFILLSDSAKVINSLPPPSSYVEVQ